MTWVVAPEWTGETCFILGGGPSLRNVDVVPLRDRGRVIAINESFRLAPWADVLYFCDKDWWLRNRAQVEEIFTGRYIVTMQNQFPGVKTLRCSGELGLETDPAAIRHGSNSGYQAINLAYHFGASPIVLLGYDMHVANGRTHWHQGYPDQTPTGYAHTLRGMAFKFQYLVSPLRAAGVKVLNVTQGSALDCFPVTTLENIQEILCK